VPGRPQRASVGHQAPQQGEVIRNHGGGCPRGATCTLPRLGQKGVGGASEGFPEGKHQGRRRGPPLEIKHPGKGKGGSQDVCCAALAALARFQTETSQRSQSTSLANPDSDRKESGQLKRALPLPRLGQKGVRGPTQKGTQRSSAGGERNHRGRRLSGLSAMPESTRKGRNPGGGRTEPTGDGTPALSQLPLAGGRSFPPGPLEQAGSAWPPQRTSNGPLPVSRPANGGT